MNQPNRTEAEYQEALVAGIIEVLDSNQQAPSIQQATQLMERFHIVPREDLKGVTVTSSREGGEPTHYSRGCAVEVDIDHHDLIVTDESGDLLTRWHAHSWATATIGTEQDVEAPQ
jgi:hypothetical protein